MKAQILIVALLSLSLVIAQNCPQGQLKFNGNCSPCGYISGCVSYASSGNCNLCEYGYQVVNGRCSYIQKPTSQCCIQTSSDGVCIKCAPGLYLEGNSCLKIERPGCLEGQGLQCTNCASGYQNINGRCLKTIESCVKYSEIGACIQCTTGFSIVRGLCSPIISLEPCANCEIQNEYGCVKCLSGFFLTKDRTCKTYASGCLQYWRESCQLCQSGFKLVNGQCLMEGCQEYTASGCNKCSSPFVLNLGKCLLPNCLQSVNGLCTICNNDYRIKNGQCVLPNEDTCKNCANGYYVGLNGKCYKNIIGCQTHTQDGKCSQCSGIFILTNGACYIPGCDKFNDSGCVGCLSPFQLSAGRCILEQCNDYNYESRNCKVCKAGFHLENGYCVQDNPLCLTYTSQNLTQLCSSCRSSDYILNDQYICVPKQPGCVYQYGKCISCAFPFKQAANSSQCVIDGCTKYLLTGCVTCASPYQLSSNTCIIPNCEIVGNNCCTKCNSGYYLNSQGLCIQNDPRCVAYSGDKCQKCASGYQFNTQGICVRIIENCVTISNQQCQQCATGYQIVNGICVLSDKYCKVFSTQNIGCSQCVAGYHTESGICKINDPTCALYQDSGFTQICKTCTVGYVFTTNGQKCVQQVPGCIYDSYGLCSSCKAPFILSGGSCMIYGCNKYTQTGCYECKSPCQISGDKCVIQFCQTYDQYSVACTKCQSGYQLNQGQCVRQDPKCVEYNTQGVCISCYKDYTVFEGVCIKQDINCLTYSKNGGCIKCKDNFYVPADGICLPQQPGCIYQSGKCTMCNYPFKFDSTAQKCRIDGCLEVGYSGCTKCRTPFEIVTGGICQIPNCVTAKDNACSRCTPGYHLKQGLYCVKNDPICLLYNDDGDCELCDKGYLLMSSGQCEIAEDNCVTQKSGQCLACKSGYFLNTFFQCQKKDENCEAYCNGICTQCKNKFFLYSDICFPYSPGCLTYSGKDCTLCKSSYTLVNGECFALKKPSLQLEGMDDEYDFEITPIDITKSKYYIDNLSPISALGKCFYSSYSIGYTDPRLTSAQENLYPKGWKSENVRSGEYIGYILQDTEPVTFYAIQIEGVDSNYISSFYLEYSVDGVNFIRIEKEYNCTESGSKLTTIYFTALYAKAIRIIVKSYVGWPAARIEFFYYDVLRFRKISNLKSLTYLKESIQSNFVDRMDNQMYINQRAFFTPAKTCENKAVCFSGLELCSLKTVNSLSIGCSEGTLKKVYVTYSVDGSNFNCFEKCRQILFDSTQSSNLIILNKLMATNVRVYPVQYTGQPKISITYDYI